MYLEYRVDTVNALGDLDDDLEVWATCKQDAIAQVIAATGREVVAVREVIPIPREFKKDSQ